MRRGWVALCREAGHDTAMPTRTHGHDTASWAATIRRWARSRCAGRASAGAGTTGASGRAGVSGGAGASGRAGGRRTGAHGP